MHEPRPHTADHATIGRRAVVASAWAAPVVVMAAAAPAAVASPTAGFDVALDPPQIGDSAIMFNADYTHVYRMDVPMGWVVANHGREQAPGGFPFSVTFDDRVWDITGLHGFFNGDPNAKPAALPGFSKTSSGHATTATATVPVAIPPGTDSFSGYFVVVEGRTFQGDYPHDGIDNPTDRRWAVVPPAGDTNSADNVVQFESYTDLGAKNVWGVLVDDAWEYATWSGGQQLRRPTSCTFTSVGPKPTPAHAEIHLSTDARMSSKMEATNVTVNGAAANALTRTDSRVSGTQVLVSYTVSTPLAKDDVLRFDVSYTDNAPSAQPSDVNAGQTNLWNADDPNDITQRAVPRASVDH